MEPMDVRNWLDYDERRTMVLELLDKVDYDVSISSIHMSSPAVAAHLYRSVLSLKPALICDESVSALDVSVQAQVLNLKDLQAEMELTYIFIDHLSVVKFMSDMMAVMNAGKFVEFGPSESIYAAPQEDYTRRLISAIPRDSLEQIDMRQSQRRDAQAR